MAARELARNGFVVRVGDEALIDSPVLEAVLEHARAAAREPRPRAGPCELGGRRVWFKAGHLRGSSRRRHGLRRLAGFLPPRLAELENLRWLRERLFLAPEPLVAGVELHGLLPGFQFLATAELEETVTMRAFLEAGPAPDERTAVLDELARETARMHALHFVHHDLFPRNLLVGPRAWATRVAFLDAWAGGPGPGLRGPAYDVACWTWRASGLLDADELDRWRAVYAAERAAQGRPLRAGFDARVRRKRDALARINDGA